MDDNMFFDDNDLIEEVIDQYGVDSSRDDLIEILDAIRQRIHSCDGIECILRALNKLDPSKLPEI